MHRVTRWKEMAGAGSEVQQDCQQHRPYRKLTELRHSSKPLLWVLKSLNLMQWDTHNKKHRVENCKSARMKGQQGVPSRCFPMSLKTPAFAFLKLDIYARWEHREESNFLFNFLSPSLSLKIYPCQKMQHWLWTKWGGRKKPQRKKQTKRKKPTTHTFCSLFLFSSADVAQYSLTELPDLSGPNFVTSLHSIKFCVLSLKVCWQLRRLQIQTFLLFTCRVLLSTLGYECNLKLERFKEHFSLPFRNSWQLLGAEG